MLDCVDFTSYQCSVEPATKFAPIGYLPLKFIELHFMLKFFKIVFIVGEQILEVHNDPRKKGDHKTHHMKSFQNKGKSI